MAGQAVARRLRLSDLRRSLHWFSMLQAKHLDTLDFRFDPMRIEKRRVMTYASEQKQRPDAH